MRTAVASEEGTSESTEFFKRERLFVTSDPKTVVVYAINFYTVASKRHAFQNVFSSSKFIMMTGVTKIW